MARHWTAIASDLYSNGTERRMPSVAGIRQTNMKKKAKNVQREKRTTWALVLGHALPYAEMSDDALTGGSRVKISFESIRIIGDAGGARVYVAIEDTDGDNDSAYLGGSELGRPLEASEVIAISAGADRC